MVRVLHLIQSGDRGGAQRHVRDVVMGRPELVAGVVAGTEGWLTAEVAALGIPVYRIPLGRSARAAVSGPARRELARRAAECRADLLHAHGIVAFALALRAGVDLPLVYTSHGALWRDPGAPAWLRLGAWLLVRQARSRVRAFVAVSEDEGDALRRLGLPRERLAIIPNGVAIPEGRRDPVSNTLGVATRLVPGKGVEELLGVLRLLPEARLLVAGEGPAAGALRQRAKALGVAPRVTWLGWQDDLSDFYQRIAVYATLSHKEGLPYAVLDAMAAGVPVVASEIGAHRELLGDEGALVPLGRPERTAAVIRSLLLDEGERERLAQAGRRRVAERFGLPAMLDGLAALYGEVAGERREAERG